MGSVRAATTIAVAFAIVGLAPFGRLDAWACATCACGDPTLTSVGVEKPYRNRLRLALEERVGYHTSGAGAGRSELLMTRTQLAVSYTPHPRVTLAAFLPFIASRLRDQRRSGDWVRGLGDLELLGRFVVARDRAFAPRHLLWLSGGLKFPTAPRVRDDDGYPYPEDDQPGSGSWDPLLGATYAYFQGFVTAYSSLLLRVTTPNPRGSREGLSLLSSTVVQLQPFARVAFQLGADLRYEAADRLSSGADSPDSGGFVVAATQGVLVNPVGDLLLRFAVEVPVVQALRGTQSLGPQLVVSVIYDAL